MAHDLLIAVTCVIVLGVGAQWLAWWFRLPSILLLLLLGFLAGPVTGLLRPDHQFGDLLLPLVSLSVGMILYEGGLSLRLSELRDSGAVVWKLVSIGAAVTWVTAALAAAFLLGLPKGLATLLGAILVVTGPTVIGPMLQHIRPTGPAASVLKWEGIVIDPIGAMLAVLVFEVLLAGSPQQATQDVAVAVIKTIVVGGAFGFGAGLLLALLLRGFLIADFLENAVSVMLVVGVYTAAEQLQAESGLLATTVMGVTLANQKLADVRHIVEFKENLRVLLISGLFIVLAARLRTEDLETLGWQSLVFLAVLVVVSRPLAVFASTIRSSLSIRERLFLAWLAPRGIVAAAVSSVFALRLEAEGIPEAALLVPYAFLVIIGTVVLYGLTAPTVARRLELAVPDPQGVLIVGAHAWARAIAEALTQQKRRVVLVDTNRSNIAAARMAGLPTYAGSILAEHALDEIDLGGLGKLIALTPNDWVNVLAVQRAARIFGRADVYQLPSREQGEKIKAAHRHLHGRWLFAEGADYAELSRRFARGAVVKATRLSEEFDLDDLRGEHGEEALPLFVIGESGQLTVVTADQPAAPKAGEVVISLVEEKTA